MTLDASVLSLGQGNEHVLGLTEVRPPQSKQSSLVLICRVRAFPPRVPHCYTALVPFQTFPHQDKFIPEPQNSGQTKMSKYYIQYTL